MVRDPRADIIEPSPFYGNTAENPPSSCRTTNKIDLTNQQFFPCDVPNTTNITQRWNLAF